MHPRLPGLVLPLPLPAKAMWGNAAELHRRRRRPTVHRLQHSDGLTNHSLPR